MTAPWALSTPPGARRPRDTGVADAAGCIAAPLTERSLHYRFPTASGFATLMGFPAAKASNWSTARV
jgi:hypothetical protein